MKRPKLSVVVPAYNEEYNFKTGKFVGMLKWLEKQPYTKEVIVVNDGSSDKTPEMIKKRISKFKFAKMITTPHRGKAFAVKTGMLESKGKLVIFTDFDQSTPISESKKLMQKIKQGYDIAIGSREAKGAKREKEPLYRHLMGRVFNALVRIVLLNEFADTQCGFKMFTRQAAQKIFSQLKHYDQQRPKHASVGAFDVEVLFLARKMGFKVVEVPIVWKHFKTQKVNPVRDSTKMALEVLQIRLRDMFGKYE